MFCMMVLVAAFSLDTEDKIDRFKRQSVADSVILKCPPHQLMTNSGICKDIHPNLLLTRDKGMI